MNLCYNSFCYAPTGFGVPMSFRSFAALNGMSASGQYAHDGAYGALRSSHVARLPYDQFCGVLERPRTTVDVIPVRDGSQGYEFFLGIRSWQPAKGMLWYFGGGMEFGTFEDSAVVHTRSHLGIEIDPRWLSYLGVNNLMWPERRDGEKACQDISHVFALELPYPVSESLRPNEEILNARWYTASELLGMQEIHPVLLKLIRAYLAENE